MFEFYTTQAQAGSTINTITHVRYILFTYNFTVSRKSKTK